MLSPFTIWSMHIQTSTLVGPKIDDQQNLLAVSSDPLMHDVIRKEAPDWTDKPTLQ